MLINPKGYNFYIFRHYSTFSERKISIFVSKKCVFFPVGEKRFASLIEHERHPLGVLNLFFELFIMHPGHVLKTWRFWRLRYGADFRRSRLVYEWKTWYDRFFSFRHCVTFRNFFISEKGPPLSFLIFYNRMYIHMFINPKASPFCIIRHYPTISGRSFSRCNSKRPPRVFFTSGRVENFY